MTVIPLPTKKAQPKNEECIRWDENKRRYRVSVRAGKDAQGKPVRLVKCARTIEEAREIRRGFLARRKALAVIEREVAHMTIAQWLEQWQQETAKEVADTTQDYRRCKAAFILPYLGHLTVSSLDRKHVRTWVTRRCHARA